MQFISIRHCDKPTIRSAKKQSTFISNNVLLPRTHWRSTLRNDIYFNCFFLLISLILLAGCTNNERFDRNPSFTNRSFIVLKHPKTKDFKECNIDPNEPNPFRMYETMDKCKEEYEDKGYKVFTQH